jgi:hypothetical protein
MTVAVETLGGFLVGWRRAFGAVAPAIEAEDAAEEGPAEWDVGYVDGGCYFTDIPVEVYGAVGMGEVVVAV